MKHTVTIEKMVFGGQGLSRLADGRAVFVWNALPGETVEIELIKKKKDYAEGVAVKILTPSPDRIEPSEPGFLSTSPWQIMTAAAEHTHKLEMALETYGKIGGLILQGAEPELVSPKHQFGYRNKLEFSFAELPDGSASLAFFERGKKIKTPVQGSKLAEPAINAAAQHILIWVNKHRVPMRSLKSIIVRSNGNGEAIAALFIKDKLTFDVFPTLGPLEIAEIDTDTTQGTESSHAQHTEKLNLRGFQLYYSTHKSPASVPTELLHTNGDNFLTAELLGTKLRFGLLSFFQINIPIFEEALKDIAAFVGPKTPLVDFYSGVGAIGLPIAKNRTETILVDENEEAIEYARQNIELNNLQNCSAHNLPAETITEVISHDKIIILDPPRAGLHKKVIMELIKKKPKRIIYLSCNISTQARDIQMLSEFYRPVFIKLYNFFPRTPHIEGLCIIE